MASAGDEPRPRVAQVANTAGIVLEGMFSACSMDATADVVIFKTSRNLISNHTFRIIAVGFAPFETPHRAIIPDFCSPGRTRVNRLLLIASTSTVLSVDALKLAMQEILSNGRDVQQYRNVWEELRSLAPNDPDTTFNRQWAEQTERANESELRRLESELKGYKNNLVKESIRVRRRQNNNPTSHLLTLNRWATKISPNFLKAQAR